jgi:hypothetical protein
MGARKKGAETCGYDGGEGGDIRCGLAPAVGTWSAPRRRAPPARWKQGLRRTAAAASDVAAGLPSAVSSAATALGVPKIRATPSAPGVGRVPQLGRSGGRGFGPEGRHQRLALRLHIALFLRRQGSTCVTGTRRQAGKRDAVQSAMRSVDQLPTPFAPAGPLKAPTPLLPRSGMHVPPCCLGQECTCTKAVRNPAHQPSRPIHARKPPPHPPLPRLPQPRFSPGTWLTRHGCRPRRRRQLPAVTPPDAAAGAPAAATAATARQ